jgi:hypothetical protein
MSEDHQHEHGDADEQADPKAEPEDSAPGAEERSGDDPHSKAKGNVAKAVGEADAYGEG